MKTYEHIVEPINSQRYWEKTPFPPLMKVQPGRTKKKRNKRNDIPPELPNDSQKLRKVGGKLHCNYCQLEGHNARTCAAKI